MAPPKYDLPDVDEPIEVGATLVPPRQAVAAVEVPTHSDAVKLVMGARRKVADMPMPPKSMNAVALVCFYTMWGLEPQDIAAVSGLSVKQINNMRMSQEYAKLQETVVATCLNADDGDVRNYIKRHAATAANKMVGLIHHGDPKVAARASADILDRSGHRPADTLNVRMQMEGGLRIEVVDKSGEDKRPVIDGEIIDGNGS